MANDVKLDIEAALEEAAKPEAVIEGSSPEKSSGGEPEAEAEAQASKKGKGANDRIQELLSKSKELHEKLEKTSSTVTERDAEISKLLDLLQAREEDSRVVKKINELYANTEYKPYIEYIDKLVRGEEVTEPPELSSKKTQKAVEDSAKILKEISSTKADLEKAIAERDAKQILDKADSLTDSWLRELPKEYTEEDKKILQEALVNRIDWDVIEEKNGENLKQELQTGFQKTLDWYGRPKGLTPPKEESEKKEKESPEEAAQKLRKFIDQPWGEMEDRKDPKGNTARAPKVSDEEFSSALAQLLKRGVGF